jgi:outer membrane protein TolC
MKQNKLFVMTALIICAAATFVQAEEYDLAAYLAKVGANNLDLALAARDTALAKTGVTQARSAFLPRVGLEGGYTRNLTDSMRSTPVASAPGGGPLVYQDVDSNYDNELTLGIGLTQTLFDAGAIANYQKALKGEAIRQQSQEAS